MFSGSIRPIGQVHPKMPFMSAMFEKEKNSQMILKVLDDIQHHGNVKIMSRTKPKNSGQLSSNSFNSMKKTQQQSSVQKSQSKTKKNQSTFSNRITFRPYQIDNYSNTIRKPS